MYFPIHLLYISYRFLHTAKTSYPYMIGAGCPGPKETTPGPAQETRRPTGPGKGKGKRDEKAKLHADTLKRGGGYRVSGSGYIVSGSGVY